MVRLRAFAMLAALAATPVAAAEARDIPWYERNPAARAEVLRRCHDDHRLHLDPATAADCANAEAAATRSMARPERGRRGSFDDFMMTPDYWTQNPIARGGVLVQCARRGPADAMAFPYCDAARRSMLQEKARRGD